MLSHPCFVCFQQWGVSLRCLGSVGHLWKKGAMLGGWEWHKVLIILGACLVGIGSAEDP